MSLCHVHILGGVDSHPLTSSLDMPTPPAANASGTGESAKRKASDMPSAGGSSSSVKRRAPRACLVCRNRKVRCDVMQSSVPCTNCRLDNTTCVLSEPNRGKSHSVAVEGDAYSEDAQDDRATDMPVSLTFEGNMVRLAFRSITR